MREIKFRVWCDGMMLTPAYIGEFGEWYITGRDVEDGTSGKTHLMQFTGLKDKNGKEIYEGDMVRLIQANRFYTVEWMDLTFKLIHLDPKLDRMQWGSLFRVTEMDWTIEVVGNIYENPALVLTS